MTDARDRLAIALDVPDLATAEEIAREVSPWFGIAKVGLELYSAAGPEAVARMRALDLHVFADLKMYDIPTTVERGARALGHQGITYLNFPAVGGVDMLRAGVTGLAEGAREAGHAQPIPIAVTVLTSERDTSAFEGRLQAAIDAGCKGVVCSIEEIARVHRAQSDFVTIVPGVRFADGERHDQARVGTPDAVAREGADVLVVGRAVTAATDRASAAKRVYDAVANA